MCCSRSVELPDDDIFRDVGKLIEEARTRVAATADFEIVMLRWSIGKRVREDVRRCERAEDRQRLIAAVAAWLTARYGPGYGVDDLRRMARAADLWPGRQLVETLFEGLGWSHVVRILAVEGHHEREFYALLASKERWSVRTLSMQIDACLFQRATAPHRPVNFLENELAAARAFGSPTPDATFCDPYVRGFLGLPERQPEGGSERQ
jgi:hypothetical protein